MANKVCGYCGTSKSCTQYHKSPMEKGMYLPLCKLCCSKKLKYYTEILENDNAALWLVLSELGVPVFFEILQQVEIIKASMSSFSANTDIVNIYLRCLSESGRIVHGFWESDVMFDMLIDCSINRDKEVKQIDWDKEQKIWGKYVDDNGKLDEDAYYFLNETMEDYTSEMGELDANTEKRFRDLCRCELRLRKANEAGDGGEISKAQDSLNKQLALLKLNEFNSKDTDERKQFIDRIAWMIEETEPAEEEDKEKYRDIAGYEKVYDSFMRSMKNMLLGRKEYPGIPVDEV